MRYLEPLNTNIDRITVLAFFFVVVLVVALWSILIGVAAFIAVFAATGLVKFLGFRWGRNRILNKGRGRLNMWHGFRSSVLRQGVGDNRRWYGRDLHGLTPYIAQHKVIIAYT